MTNTVIEFEQDRRIAWQTVLAGPLGRFLGGRIWRYELEPVEGGTKVTESWDLSQDKQAFFLKNPKIGQHTADVHVQDTGPAGRDHRVVSAPSPTPPS